MTKTNKILAAAVFAAASMPALSAINIAQPGLTARETPLQLGGAIDTGIVVLHQQGKTDVTLGDSNSNFSQFDFRGLEKLGESGNYVRYLIRTRYNSDNGAQKDSVMHDQTMLAVGGRWGELAFGRIGNIRGSLGDYALFPMIGANPTGTALAHNKLSPVFSAGGSSDNTIVYVSPTVNGFGFTGQYSNGADETVSHWSDRNELATLAATYVGQKFRSAAALTWNSRGAVKAAQKTNIHQTWDLYLGGTYDFGAFTATASYQFIRDGRLPGGAPGSIKPASAFNKAVAASPRGFDSHALAFGVRFDALGGKIGLLAAANQSKFKGNASLLPSGAKANGYRYLFGSSYKYFFSKRTHAYILANYSKGTGIYKYEAFATQAADPIDQSKLAVGIHHRF